MSGRAHISSLDVLQIYGGQVSPESRHGHIKSKSAGGAGLQESQGQTHGHKSREQTHSRERCGGAVRAHMRTCTSGAEAQEQEVEGGYRSHKSNHMDT
eukprot:1153432-Pelagomonas_calceolata.AAC.4